MKDTVWKICCALVIIIAVLTLSPLVLSEGKHKPELMGMPYILWVGIAISLLLWVITYVGVLFHPGKDD